MDYFRNASKIPKYCVVCGSRLEVITDKDGFNELTGKQRYYRWLKCPKATSGRTMYRKDALITYTALPLNDNLTDFSRVFIGYTKYVTCDLTIVY